jgi:molybdopterin-guanine dinucleotide biosynthesis protein A
MSISGNLTIVIQAGGESKRMGRSKATVPFLGEPLLWRGVNRLLPLADELLITTNEPENLGFLDELVQAGKIRLVTDICEQRGALRGVYTALDAATKEFVALVACDMIFPSRHLIAAELEELMESGNDAAVPKTQYGYEPFHGVYLRETCLPATIEAVEAGEIKAGNLLERVKVTDFTAQMVAEAEPRGGCFINVNTPQELADAEARILAGEMRERDEFVS